MAAVQRPALLRPAFLRPAFLRRHGLAVCAAALLALGAIGCRNDMHDQPRYEPLEISTFHPDSQASRAMIVGTVPRGGLRIDQLMYAGRTGSISGGVMPSAVGNPPMGADSARGTTSPTGPGLTAGSNGTTVATTAGADAAMKGFATTFPFPVTREVLLRGESRYNIYCAPCHGRTGAGNGMIVQRGFKTPPSFHETRLQSAPAGYIFDVITNGFGVMYSYASRISPEDRWKIVAYIRALQLSQNASVRDLSAADQQNLERMK